MKKLILITLILIIIGAGVYVTLNNNANTTINTPKTENSATSLPNNTDTSSPSNVLISIKNFSFNPLTTQVKIGTKVTWINNDTVPHTVTSDSDSILNSKTLSPGQSFSYTFTAAGTVQYHCAIHTTMKGTVVVQ